MKISCDKEIHLLNKKVSITELREFISASFKNLPREFSVTYLDSDGDNISLVSEEDVKTLYDTSSNDKFVKVIVAPLDSSDERITDVQETRV